MKNYDAKFIKKFIEENKDNIQKVSCGMREDWSWTADTIYEDGKMLVNLDNDTVEIVGIDGSYWATPVMEVLYKDGTSEIKDCYTSDDKDCSEQEKDRMKSFVTFTGGMDFKK